MFFWRLTSSAALACVLLAGSAVAQQTANSRPYDGLQAGVDAFRLAEEKRQAAVADQLFLNVQAWYWNGYPTSRGATIYYGYMSPAAAVAYGYAPPFAPRTNLDYAYAYGNQRLWGGRDTRAFGPPSVFEPWPFVPGDIWGYPHAYQPARQPIGQQQVQTGPNRWESHPVYDPPLTLHRPLPPVDSPLLDGTPYATPKDVLPLPAEAIPPPPPRATSPQPVEAVPPGPPTTPAAPRRGPREY